MSLSRILYVPLAPDHSQRALRQTIALALEHGAELVLAETGAAAVPDAHAERLVFDARLDGLRVSRRVLGGPPGTALALEAERGVDLVVLAVERPTGMTALLRRLPWLDVARALPVTTWLVPRDLPRRPGVVVAALALGDHVDPAARLADEQSLAAAAAQAMRTGARLVVAHAWRGTSWDQVRRGAPSAAAIVDERRRRIEAMLAARAEVACGAVDAEVRLERGSPGESLARVLRRESATLLVAAARPNAGAGRGATIDRATRGFEGSVLMVRPVAVPPRLRLAAGASLSTA